MAKYDKADLERRMKGAVESLRHDLGGLRTGRANTTLLDPVTVEVYGSHMPLNQVATVSAPEPRLLSVQVWDKSLVKAVDDLGLTETTYVIYMSDNGAGGGSKGALNGGKGDVYEGGVRVPFIVRGPGVKANSWCNTRIVGYDLLPTFCEWAGVPAAKLPKAVEGGSLVKVIADGKGEVKRPRDGLVFHFPHYQGDTPHSAIIVGDLKLMKFYEDNRVLLFDLAQDLREQIDLSKKRPEDTAKLEKQLTEYLKAVDAQMPTPNPKYNPKAPPPPSTTGARRSSPISA